MEKLFTTTDIENWFKDNDVFGKEIRRLHLMGFLYF